MRRFSFTRRSVEATPEETATMADNFANQVPDDSIPEPDSESSQLCISTALIGLVGSSAQTYNDMEDVLGKPTASTMFLFRALQILKSFKLTIQLMYKFMRRFEINMLDQKDRPELIDIDVIVIVLSESALALSETGNMLLDAVRQAHETGCKLEYALTLYQLGIGEAAARLELADSAMTKLLSVLQIGSDIEALRYRAQAEEIIQIILQTNHALAGRVRALNDSFGARGLVPPERLEHISQREPPGYSGETVRSDEVPGYTERTLSGFNADGSVTIRATAWTIFSGLTLRDISILTLIPLPITSGELRYGNNFYTADFCRDINPALGELMEMNIKAKTKKMAELLGLRSKADMSFMNAFTAKWQTSTRSYENVTPRRQNQLLTIGASI